jgi:SAM-dependent methyltransferase
MYRLRAHVFQRVARGLAVDWSSARVLDVGSGTGFYVDQWHKLGVPKVVGLDITEKAVGELRQHFPGDQFFQVDIGGKELPPPVSRLLSPAGLAPGGFDAISAMDVLFHIVDDYEYAQAFRNIASLLKPGGWFIWSDNFLRHGTERVAHQVSRSLAESEAAVKAAGFEIVDRRPMFVLMNYPADSRSKLAKWTWTAMVAPAAVGEGLGSLVGALLYPLDKWLTASKQESPSTEVMVCQRRESALAL